MMQHQLYRDQVRDAIRRRNGAAIFNGSVDHASIIVQEAFSTAAKTIKILTHKLDPDCYAREAVQHAAQYFLADSSHKACILVETELWDKEGNYQWSEHPLIKELKSFTEENSVSESQLTIKRVPKEWIDKDYKFNFLLIDDYGYRYEANRQLPSAVATFLPVGEEYKMNFMEKWFDEIWSTAKKIDIN